MTSIPANAPQRQDVDVTGKWKERTSIQAFVDIKANEVGFRGLPVSDANVLVWYAYGFAELIGLEALTDGYGTRGDIAFTFARPGSKNGNRVFVDVSTIQPLDTIPVVFGPDMEVLAELMRFESPPLTQIKGFVNYGAEAAIKQSIDLKILSRSAGTFRRVPFDRIQLNVYQENTLNFIPLLEGEIDEGRISLVGEIKPATKGEGWAADLLIDSDNLPLETFKKILIELDPAPSLTPRPPKDSAAEGESGPPTRGELRRRSVGKPRRQWRTAHRGRKSRTHPPLRRPFSCLLLRWADDDITESRSPSRPALNLRPKKFVCPI